MQSVHTGPRQRIRVEDAALGRCVGAVSKWCGEGGEGEHAGPCEDSARLPADRKCRTARGFGQKVLLRWRRWWLPALSRAFVQRPIALAAAADAGYVVEHVETAQEREGFLAEMFDLPRLCGVAAVKATGPWS